MDAATDQNAAVVRRRYVLYVEGYDPQGAAGYYGLLNHASKRFLKNWPSRLAIGPLSIDSPDLAHWEVDATGANWRTQTHYDFLRQEDMIRANIAEPMRRQVPLALYWLFNYLGTGTMWRIFRAAPRMAAGLTYFQLLMLAWLAAAGAIGSLVGALAMWVAHGPVLFAIIIGLVAAIAAFKLLRPVADKFFTVQINNHWPHLIDYGRGRPNCFDRCVEAGAQRLVEVSRAGGNDEIVVVGHSGGAILAPALIVRALEIDPELGRRGPRLVLLTPGSIMPALALHPQAERVRRDIARIAVEPSVLWVHVTAHADWLNFAGFDPVAGIGVDVGAERCNPLVWAIRFRDMMDQRTYHKARWNLFRLHYQVIMGNDMRAPYDYLMLVCGPARVEQWARLDRAMLAQFSEDGRFDPPSL